MSDRRFAVGSQVRPRSLVLLARGDDLDVGAGFREVVEAENVAMAKTSESKANRVHALVLSGPG